MNILLKICAVINMKSSIFSYLTIIYDMFHNIFDCCWSNGLRKEIENVKIFQTNKKIDKQTEN